MNFKHLGLIMTLALSTSCTNPTPHSTFRVGLRVLPKRLDPRENEINVFHYINTHVYYPMFEVNLYGQVESHFVDMTKTRAMDETFQNYQICLKDQLKFRDFTPVKTSHLIQALTFAHKKNLELPKLQSVTAKGDCAVVRLAASESRYFNKLTTIETTILKEEPRDGLNTPVGIGPYDVTAFSDSKIVLKRPAGQDASHAINEVEFVKIATAEDGLKQDIHDWNHLWQHLGNNAPIPSAVKNSWRRFDQNLVRSLMIVLHIKDQALRRKISACFDARKYVTDLGLTVSDIPGLLPTGLAGANVSFAAIKSNWTGGKDGCSPEPDPAKRKVIPFYVFYPSIEPQVRKFFEATKDHFPVEVKVVGVSVEEAIKRIMGNEELMIASLADTQRVSPTGFFTPFVGKNSIILNRISGLEETVRSAALANDAEMDSLFAKAHRMLLNSGAIIPLGQVRTVHYYPLFIRNIPVIEPANGFPRLDLVEVR